MSDPALSGFAGQTTGASDLAGEEPHRVIVRGTANRAYLGQRILRDEHYTVDANDPDIREALARGYFEPLPAREQPTLATDPVTLQPTLKPKETRMTMQWITVTDANGNDFEALTPGPVSDEVGSELPAFVFFDERENGFGLNATVSFLNAKRLGAPNEGKYGA